MAAATKTKLKIKPLDDRILIEQCEAAKEKPQRGIVSAVGPGTILDSGERGEMDVKVGDEVFYGKYSGTEVEIDGDPYVIIKQSDVLAIIS